MLSAYFQFAPYKLRKGIGTSGAANWSTSSSRRLACYSPNRQSGGSRARHHAAGSGIHLRLHRWPHFSRRIGAGPDLHHAAGAGLGALPNSRARVVPCGNGTHPGNGLTGARRKRREGNHSRIAMTLVLGQRSAVSPIQFRQPLHCIPFAEGAVRMTIGHRCAR